MGGYFKQDVKDALKKDTRVNTNDINAVKELQELEEEKQKGQITKVKHRLLVFSIYILWIIAVIILIIRLLHFITPEDAKVNYLTDDQIQIIDRVLFSGAIGSWMTKYGQKVFD